MTTQDLQEEITLLGQGNEVSNEKLFRISLNRALRKLYLDRRIEKNVRIAARTLTPIAYYRKIECKAGKVTEIPLSGIAYSMRLHGTGNYMITDGEAINTYPFASTNEAKVVKGFVGGNGGKITFYSSFSFTVYDLAMYDEMYSQYTEDIPSYGPRTVFNIRELYGDFMCFTSPATDSNGNPIDGCKLYDGKVEVDSSYRGEIVLSYRRLPIEIVTVASQDDIDVPEEYKYLLILLTAAYYWYYTDDDLAKYYLSQYEESIKSLKENSYDHIDPAYIDTNGWA